MVTANSTEDINYWLNKADEDLKCFTDKERVRQLYYALDNLNQLHYYQLPERKGVTAYVITDDFKGGTCVSELFTYILPKYRGNIRLFKTLLNHLESAAEINKCSCVQLSGNTGYNDEGFVRVLKRFGYKLNGATKEM